MFKISVIIPIYNMEKYLNRCLDSIVNQTYKNLEIICVNDGSKDSSLDILNAYKSNDSRIVVIDKENGGLSSARNAGFEVATSEWISFVDSDDWLDLNTFEEVSKYFEKNPDVICFGTHMQGDTSEEMLRRDEEYYSIKHEGFVKLTDDIRLTTDVATWNKIYKKSIIDKYSLRFPVGKHYEDFPFYWEYIFESKTAYYIKDKFYNYLRRPDSIMANTFKKTSNKVLDHLYAVEIIYDYLKGRNILEEHIETLAEIFVTCLYFVYWNSPTDKKKVVFALSNALLKKLNLGKDFNDKSNVIKNLRRKKYRKIVGDDYPLTFIEKIFSIRNIGIYKQLSFLGIRIKRKNKYKVLEVRCSNISSEIIEKQRKIEQLQDKVFQLEKNLNTVNYLGHDMPIIEMLCYQHLDFNADKNALKSFDIANFSGKAMCATDKWQNMKYLFPNLQILPFSENATILDFYFLWGTRPFYSNCNLLQRALFVNQPAYILEDGFLKSIDTWVNENAPQRYRDGVSFTVDNIVPYYDARFASHMELMLNDKELVITDEQKQRARKCIDKIIETHLTKYNHQPIFEPKIGREGVKKVLVVDQSYGDMSIAKGLADENTFKEMLECAIKENPDADIIVKTHPDTIAGAGGYYKGLKAHDNIYTQTEPINPISLIKYVDKVYVCTTQFGFEALMCGKEVHVFGMPFYAGWGLTHDRQKCARRTNTRTLEEVFYIAYIMYTYYVNPDKQCRCEIEEAMDYLLKLREEYLNE